MADQSKGAVAAKAAGRKAAPFGAAAVAGGLIAAGFGAAGVALALALTASSGPALGGKESGVHLAPVAQADLEAALQTIAPEDRDQVRSEVAACKTALFMMEISPMPGAKEPASGFVQVRSDTYLSPRFAVGKTATSFAVPHPIPDAKTLIAGTIRVIGSARSVRVSFDPPVDYPVVAGATAQPVIFDLPQNCGIDGGKAAE